MSNTTEERPFITSDVVLFSIVAGEPCVLLIKRGWDPFKGAWALPGGHVDAGETFLEAAARELAEETGIMLPTWCLAQTGFYDVPDRDPRGRYVSVAFAAVIRHREPVAGDDAESAQWVPLASLSRSGLAFDHAAIVQDAYFRYADEIDSVRDAERQRRGGDV